MCSGTSLLLHPSVGEPSSLLARGRHQGTGERCSRQGWCFIQVGDDWELPPVPLLVWLLFHFVLAPTEHLLTCCTSGCVSAAVFSVVCSQGRNEGTPKHRLRSASFTTSKLSVLTCGRGGSLSLPKTQPREALSCKIDPPNQ